MAQFDASEDQWQPCEPGQIQQMVDGLNARDRKARTAVAVRTAALIVIVAGVSLIFWTNRPHTIYGLTCAECRAGFVELHRHVQLGEDLLEPTVVSNMQGHLRECESCRQLFEKQYGALTAMGGVSGADPRAGSMLIWAMHSAMSPAAR